MKRKTLLLFTLLVAFIVIPLRVFADSNQVSMVKQVGVVDADGNCQLGAPLDAKGFVSAQPSQKLCYMVTINNNSSTTFTNLQWVDTFYSAAWKLNTVTSANPHFVNGDNNNTNSNTIMAVDGNGNNLMPNGNNTDNVFCPFYSNASQENGQNGGNFQCHISSLPANGTIMLYFEAQVLPNATPSNICPNNGWMEQPNYEGTYITNYVCADSSWIVNNGASLSGAGLNVNSLTQSVGVGTTTQAQASADLAISKTFQGQTDPSTGNPIAVPGNNIQWTLNVVNNGPSDSVGTTANPIVVTDTVPVGVNVSSVPTGCSVTPYVSGQSQTITCNITNNIEAPAHGQQGRVQFIFSGRLRSSETSSSITNSAKVAPVTPDPTTSNNTTSVTTPVAPYADMQIQKSANRNSLPAAADEAEAVTYTLKIFNNGPSYATGVSVSDAIPSVLTMGDLTEQYTYDVSPSSARGLVTCTTPGAGSPGGQVTCTANQPISPTTYGSSNPIVITIFTNTSDNLSAAGNDITNTATVKSTTTDPNTTNNTSSHTMSGKPSVDMFVNKCAADQVAGTDINVPSQGNFSCENSAPNAIAGTSTDFWMHIGVNPSGDNEGATGDGTYFLNPLMVDVLPAGTSANGTPVGYNTMVFQDGLNQGLKVATQDDPDKGIHVGDTASINNNNYADSDNLVCKFYTSQADLLSGIQSDFPTNNTTQGNIGQNFPDLTYWPAGSPGAWVCQMQVSVPQYDEFAIRVPVTINPDATDGSVMQNNVIVQSGSSGFVLGTMNQGSQIDPNVVNNVSSAFLTIQAQADIEGSITIRNIDTKNLYCDLTDTGINNTGPGSKREKVIFLKNDGPSVAQGIHGNILRSFPANIDLSQAVVYTNPTPTFNSDGTIATNPDGTFAIGGPSMVFDLRPYCVNLTTSISCDMTGTPFASLQPGQSMAFTYQLTVLANNTPNSSATDVLTAQTTTYDPNLANNVDGVTVQIGPAVKNLCITKTPVSVTPNPGEPYPGSNPTGQDPSYPQGSTFSYQINVAPPQGSNNSDVPNVTVADVLPIGFIPTSVPNNCAISQSTSGTTTAGTGSASASATNPQFTITCTFPNIQGNAPGGGAPVTSFNVSGNIASNFVSLYGPNYLTNNPSGTYYDWVDKVPNKASLSYAGQPTSNTSGQSATAYVDVTRPTQVADVKLLKSFTTASGNASPGQSIQWQVRVANYDTQGPPVQTAGPNTSLAGIVVRDPIPSGISTITSIDARCRLYNSEGSQVTGNVPFSVDNTYYTLCTTTSDLQYSNTASTAGTYQVFSITGSISPTFTGTTITNTATIDSTVTKDPNTSNNTATATVNITPQTDVSIEKSANRNSLPSAYNIPVNYTLVITNTGPSYARYVQVNDPLPSNLVFQNITVTPTNDSAGNPITCTTPTAATPINPDENGGSVTPGGGTINCSIGLLDTSTTITITIETLSNQDLAILSTDENPNNIINSATANAYKESTLQNNTDPTGSRQNNTSSHTLSGKPSVDMFVNKCFNETPGTDTLHDYEDFVCHNQNPSVIAGQSDTAFYMHVGALSGLTGEDTDADGNLIDSGTVVVQPIITDILPAGTIPNGTPTIQTIWANPDFEDRGSSFQYSMTCKFYATQADLVSNFTHDFASSNPGGVYTSADPSSDPTNVPIDIPSDSPGAWVCQFDQNFPQQDNVLVRLPVKFDPSIPDGTPMQNNTVIQNSSDGFILGELNHGALVDPDTDNNHSSVYLTVHANADLVGTISISQIPNKVLACDLSTLSDNYTGPGSSRLKTITITNKGPSTAVDLNGLVERTAPAQADLSQGVVYADPPITATMGDQTITIDNSGMPMDITPWCQTLATSISCNMANSPFADLPPGQTIKFTYPITLYTSDLPSTQAYPETLTVSSLTPDLALANNTQAANVYIGPSITSMCVNKSANNTTTNLANNNPTGYRVYLDPTTGQNTFSYTITVKPPANTISADASALQITDTLPVGFLATSVTTDNPTLTCTTRNRGTVTTTSPGTTAGTSSTTQSASPSVSNPQSYVSCTSTANIDSNFTGVTVTVTGTIAPNFIDLYTNPIVGTSNATYKYIANVPNTATASFLPLGATNRTTVSDIERVDVFGPTTADLRITKSQLNPAIPGQDGSWTITVTNYGPNVSAGPITISDTIDSNITNIRTQPSSANDSCSVSGQVVTCTITNALQANVASTANNLLPGDSATFVITGRIRSSATGSISNTATVTGITPDTVTTNNTATVTTPLTPQSDVAIKKVANRNSLPADAGLPVNYTLTVSNNGPSYAQNVVVTDVVPSQLIIQGINAPSPFTCSQTPNSDGTTTVTCNAASIARSASYQIVINTQSGGDLALIGTPITNIATVTSSTTDTNLTNNSGTHILSGNPSADMFIAKCDNQGFINNDSNDPNNTIGASSGFDATTGFPRAGDFDCFNDEPSANAGDTTYYWLHIGAQSGLTGDDLADQGTPAPQAAPVQDLPNVQVPNVDEPTTDSPSIDTPSNEDVTEESNDEEDIYNESESINVEGLMNIQAFDEEVDTGTQIINPVFTDVLPAGVTLNGTMADIRIMTIYAANPPGQDRPESGNNTLGNGGDGSTGNGYYTMICHFYTTQAALNAAFPNNSVVIPSDSPGAVVCQIQQNMPQGDNIAIRIPVKFNASLDQGSTVQNNIIIQNGSDGFVLGEFNHGALIDPNIDNNHSYLITTITTQADIQAKLSVTNISGEVLMCDLTPMLDEDGNPIHYDGPGSKKEISVTITNKGPSDAQNIYGNIQRSIDAVADLTNTRIYYNDQPMQNEDGSYIWDITEFCKILTISLTCDMAGTPFANLAAGSSIRFTYDVTTLSSDLPGSYQEILSAFTTTNDLNLDNNIDNTQNIVIGDAMTQLCLTKEALDTHPNPGMDVDPNDSWAINSNFRYALHVTPPKGTTASDAINVSLNDTLPVGFIVKSVTISSNNLGLDASACTITTSTEGTSSSLNGNVANASSAHPQYSVSCDLGSIPITDPGFTVYINGLVHKDFIKIHNGEKPSNNGYTWISQMPNTAVLSFAPIGSNDQDQDTSNSVEATAIVDIHSEYTASDVNNPPSNGNQPGHPNHPNRPHRPGHDNPYDNGVDGVNNYPNISVVGIQPYNIILTLILSITGLILFKHKDIRKD